MEIVTPDNALFNLNIKFETSDVNELYLLVNISESYNDFYGFQEYCKEKINGKERLKLRNAFSIKMSQPIANIIRNEYFYNKALMAQKTNTGYSFEVLRNKILNTKDDKNKFPYLEEKLYSVLKKNFRIRWKNKDKETDTNIRLTIEEGNGQEVDLSLVGSGVLNLLEIFSSLHSKLDGINIVLLDEPDSHIHSNIQHKLMKQLKTDPLGSQVFIITHNDRLIYSVKQEELFYLNAQSKKTGTLDYFPFILKNIAQLEHKMSGFLEESEQLYKNRPAIFVEGKTDQLILEAILEKHFSKYLERINIKHDNGHSGVTSMAISWHYQKIEKKAVALFDYDEAATDSIREINTLVPEKKRTNFKVFSLKEYKPLHIRTFYQKSIDISFSIEEMFDIEIWNYFRLNDFLITKSDLPRITDVDKSLRDHCLEKGIEEPYLVYLKKVKREKKNKAAKHIVSLIDTTNTDAMKQLVTDILCYLFEKEELELTEKSIKNNVSDSTKILFDKKLENPASVKKPTDTDNLTKILFQAWEKYKDTEGWTNIASINNYIKSIIKDFSPQKYGASKLTDLINSFPDDFEMTKYKGKGTVNIIVFRPTEKMLTICSTTDAVTARDFAQITPRRARQFRR